MNCNLQTRILWWRNSYEHFSCASGRLVIKYFYIVCSALVIPVQVKNSCRTETFNSLVIGLPFHHFWRDHLSREMSTFLPQSCQNPTMQQGLAKKSERCQFFGIHVSNLFSPWAWLRIGWSVKRACCNSHTHETAKTSQRVLTNAFGDFATM